MIKTCLFPKNVESFPFHCPTLVQTTIIINDSGVIQGIFNDIPTELTVIDYRDTKYEHDYQLAENEEELVAEKVQSADLFQLYEQGRD